MRVAISSKRTPRLQLESIDLFQASTGRGRRRPDVYGGLVRGWPAVHHPLIHGQLFMHPALPPGGSQNPGIANMRAAPHAVHCALDGLRSRAADEVKHYGTVSLQLQIIDLNAG